MHPIWNSKECMPQVTGRVNYYLLKLMGSLIMSGIVNYCGLHGVQKGFCISRRKKLTSCVSQIYINIDNGHTTHVVLMLYSSHTLYRQARRLWHTSAQYFRGDLRHTPNSPQLNYTSGVPYELPNSIYTTLQAFYCAHPP